jgi:hypothetical protein
VKYGYSISYSLFYINLNLFCSPSTTNLGSADVADTVIVAQRLDQVHGHGARRQLECASPPLLRSIM